MRGVCFTSTPLTSRCSWNRSKDSPRSGVALEARGDLVARRLLAEALGDIAHVAQCRRQVSFLHIGVEIANLAAADGLDEVLVMARPFRQAELLDPLAAPVVGPAARQIAALAIDDDAVADAAIMIHLRIAFDPGQIAQLEEDRHRLIVEVHDLRVRRLAVVDVTEAPAQTDDPGRQLVLADDPAADVDVVDAVVAEVPVAGRPEPVPIVMQVLAHQRGHRRRAAPEVVIDRLGHRLGAVDLADALPQPVDEAAHEPHLAEVALVDVVDRLAESRIRAALRSRLHDALVLAGRLDHLPALPDVVADRLLDVDILARLAGPHGDERVPVVGRRRGHHIDVLIFEQLAAVHVRVHLLAPLGEFLPLPFEEALIRIADGDDPHAGNLAKPVDVIGPLAANAHHREANVVIGPPDTRVRDSHRKPGRDRGLHEVSTVHALTSLKHLQ